MLPPLAVIPFGIHVIDRAGDPAPCVALTTTDQQRFVSDNTGWVAFDEPGLMGDSVWFEISSDSYSVPPDFFGYEGVALTPVDGQTATVTVDKTGTATCALGTVNRDAVTDGITDDPFEIDVVDSSTGRGVPLVEVDGTFTTYWTDSAGRIAVRDPAIMDQAVDFTVPTLHGYHYSGPPLHATVTEGGQLTIPMTRDNVAERLYRVTGRGVYRDTVLLGLAPPTANPVIDGRVMGQDTIMVVPYQGGWMWLFGDTLRPDYPLGLFDTAGSIAHPLADPADGVDLEYFTDPGTGFVRAMAPIPDPPEGNEPTWLGGPEIVDDGGVQKTIAFYGKFAADLSADERGIAVLDEATATFVKDTAWPAPVPAVGVQEPLSRDGFVYLEEYMRFPATIEAAREPVRSWDLLSPILADGTTDTWPDGDERWDWRPMRDGRSPGDIEGDTMIDFATGDVVEPHGDSVAWSPWRHRWQKIYTETGGTSSLGEMWYAEADTPYGPWVYTAKIASHTSYTSYNPFIHQELSTDGRRVLWEATYTRSFAFPALDPTPRYDYNQMMYRLDLEDPRVNLPTPVYRAADRLATVAELRSTDTDPVIEFLAPDRAMAGTVPVYWDGPVCDGGKLKVGGTPPGYAQFHVATTEVAGTVPLWHATSGAQDGLFVTIPAGWTGDVAPAGYVWENTDKRHSLVLDWLPTTRVDAGDDLCVQELTKGAGIVLPLDASGSPGTTGGTWEVTVDGALQATSPTASLPLHAGHHVVVVTWTSPEGTPYRDERWIGVLPAEGGGETGGTGDTGAPGETGDTGTPGTTDGGTTDGGTDDDGGGCGCATGGAGAAWTLPLGALLVLRRRRR